ncbi:hypothetical protein DFH11DRAFT_1269696 [Phellopilus nigrolimitatus]|nr:hypothetical protein DFH11DRAFT_1269696 [Phellopilus nigrolimitatus]
MDTIQKERASLRAEHPIWTSKRVRSKNELTGLSSPPIYHRLANCAQVLLYATPLPFNFSLCFSWRFVCHILYPGFLFGFGFSVVIVIVVALSLIVSDLCT